MRKIAILIMFILCFASLQRYNDYIEVAEITFVSSIGFDYNQETSEFEVYLYVINKFNLSLSQLSLGSDEILAYIVKGTGKTILDAINQIKNNTSIFYRFASVQTIVIKDTFFQNDNAKTLCNYLLDNVEIYPNYVVFFTSDELMDIYQIGNFSETSSYFTILVNSTTRSDYMKIYFSRFCNDIIEPNYSCYYPTLKVAKKMFYDQKDYFNSLSIDGISFINSDMKTTSYKQQHFPSIQWLYPLNNDIIKIKDFDFHIKKYKINYHFINDELIIKIKIKGFTSNNPSNLNSKEVEKIVDHQIANDILELKTTFDEYNIDLFNVTYLSNNRYSSNNCKTRVIVNSYELTS